MAEIEIAVGEEVMEEVELILVVVKWLMIETTVVLASGIMAQPPLRKWRKGKAKLDSKLITAFVERWRPEMHIFYLPCGVHTITLEDVQLQLGLPVDGFVLTGSAQSVD
ncbi:hypothetical protein PVK06_026264 [Gossypium arboreum]|uniref:Aminotransferase-like plant mobile domain-containing protein n=1 Tax=Gossypium arboreum TaxID=29729 RepID=A0ABR0NX69_GOSAR|nr:hypothetical protein PVK06_026264 [Gossypium arboreum]